VHHNLNSTAITFVVFPHNIFFKNLW